MGSGREEITELAARQDSWHHSMMAESLEKNGWSQ